MPTVGLSVETIEYEDTWGSGPVVVFLHGLAMDGSLWPRRRPVWTTTAWCRHGRRTGMAAVIRAPDLDLIGGRQQTPQRWRLLDSLGK